MPPAFWRMLWTVIFLVVMSYAVYLFAGSLIEASSAHVNDPVMMLDDVGRNVHHLSGMVFVPDTCAQLSATAQQVSATLFLINFTTWEEPSITCATTPTPRQFSLTVFAPSSGVQFIGELDEGALNIVVHPKVTWVNASTSIIMQTQN